MPVLRALPALALLLFVTSGCRFMRHLPYLSGQPLSPPRAFRDPGLDGNLVRRVLTLPLFDDSGFGDETQVVSEALQDEISRLGRFGLVRPNPRDARLKPAQGPHSTGRVPVATIIELGRRYGVDAVLFGTINRYRPYTPPALGMSVAMIDVETGRILWSVEDYVDSADQRCAVSMKWYFEDELATGDTVFGNELMRTSPAWFARFASHRIAVTLEPTPPQP